MTEEAGFFSTEELYKEQLIADKIGKMAKGRADRADIIQMFGGIENIPSSVMRAKRATRIDPEVDGPTHKRGYVKTSKRFVNGEYRKYPKDMVKSAIISGGYGTGAGALSTFPQNVGRSILLLYSKPGDTVFDPFAGHNSRMDICVKEHRNYIGCDLSHDFMEFNRKRAKQLRKKYPSLHIEVHECDSRQVPIKENEWADFSISSPPYWDVEEYGPEDGQLGKLDGGYKGFLDGLTDCYRETYRILKPGAYCCIFINDFRKKGKMYFYHADVIRMGKKVGFEAHDICIVDLGHGIRDCFVAQIVETRLLPKRHEYCIVLRKPLSQIPPKPRKGAKNASTKT